MPSRNSMEVLGPKHRILTKLLLEWKRVRKYLYTRMETVCKAIDEQVGKLSVWMIL